MNPIICFYQHSYLKTLSVVKINQLLYLLYKHQLPFYKWLRIKRFYCLQICLMHTIFKPEPTHQNENPSTFFGQMCRGKAFLTTERKSFLHTLRSKEGGAKTDFIYLTPLFRIFSSICDDNDVIIQQTHNVAYVLVDWKRRASRDGALFEIASDLG